MFYVMKHVYLALENFTPSNPRISYLFTFELLQLLRDEHFLGNMTINDLSCNITLFEKNFFVSKAFKYKNLCCVKCGYIFELRVNSKFGPKNDKIFSQTFLLKKDKIRSIILWTSFWREKCNLKDFLAEIIM